MSVARQADGEDLLRQSVSNTHAPETQDRSDGRVSRSLQSSKSALRGKSLWTHKSLSAADF